MTYPATGWEVRTFSLDGANALAGCLDVATLATDGIDVPTVNVPGRLGQRFTSTRSLAAGVTTLDLVHDDGVRVFVDGALVYDRWSTGTATDTAAFTAPLPAGSHQVTVERFQSADNRHLHLALLPGCQKLAVPTDGWVLTYLSLTQDGSVSTTCHGTSVSGGMSLSQSFPSTPAVFTALGVPNGFAVLARGVRTFRGRTDFTLTYAGPVDLAINTVRVFAGVAGSATTTIRTYGTVTAQTWVTMRAPAGSVSATLDWVNVCDPAPAFPAADWDVRYHRVSAGPPPTLNHDDCLGRETRAGADLAEDWTTSAPAEIAFSGLVDGWGAEYSAQRTYANPTTINLQFDDGLGVYLDGSATPLFESWTAAGLQNAQITMPAGTHQVLLRYFDGTGNATLRFGP